MKSSATFRITAALAAVYVVWGTTYLGIKLALESFQPFFQMGTRFAVAGAALFAWLKLRGRATPTARQWLHSALVGLLMLGGGTSLVAVAEQSISSGAVTVLVAFVPLWMAALSILFGQRPKLTEWGAVGIGTLGVVVLTLGQEFQASPGGTLAIVAATFFWALGSLLSRRLDLPAGPMGFAAEMFAGGFVLLAISAVLGEQWTLTATSGAWLAWGYLVVFGSIIAFSAYMYLVQTVSPTLAASYAYANPLVALAVGAWLGGERVAPQTVGALLLVFVAVALLAWANRQPAALRLPPPAAVSARRARESDR